MSGVSGQYLLSKGFGVVLNHTTSRGTERMSMDRSVVGVVATLRKQRVYSSYHNFHSSTIINSPCIFIEFIRPICL